MGIKLIPPNDQLSCRAAPRWPIPINAARAIRSNWPHAVNCSVMLCG